MNYYVLKHDFGYGKEPELQDLQKLLLRNFDDLKTYVFDLLQKEFESKIIDGNLYILDDCLKMVVIKVL